MPDFVSMKKTYHTNQQEVHLEGRLAEFRQALKDEIRAIEKNGHSTTILKNGEKVKNGSRDYWYRFFVDYMPVMPADTPCKLTIGKDTYEVTVVSCTDDCIIVSSSSPLPDALGYVKMENGSTVLMELLIKRIETNAEKTNPAGTRMLQEQSDTTPVFKRLFDYTSSQITLSSHNTADQANAVLQAIQNDITYIWGPPGTGKTTVIGQIVHNLLKQHRSVLLVSHTNTAVDGAIKKIDEILCTHPENDYASYPLLRIGIPAKEIPEKAKLEHHIHELGRDVEVQITQLNNDKNELIARIQQLQMIYMKIKWMTENKLDEISNTQEIIFELEKSRTILEQEVSTLQSRFDNLCNQYPAYREHEALLREKESLEREYNKYSSQKESTVSTIAQLERDIPLYQDELAKHQKKADLRTEIEGSVSEKSLKKQIQEQQQALTELNGQLSSLRAEQDNLTTLIAKHAQKNALAKLFSDKKAIAQAEERTREIKSLIDTLVSSIEIKEHALSATKEDLHELLVKIEQMNAISVSESVLHWKVKLANAKVMLENRQKDLPGIQERLQRILPELTQCKERFSKVQEAFAIVENARLGLTTLQNSLRDNRDELLKRKSHFTQLLEEEKYHCLTFGIQPDEKNLFESMLSILSTLRDEHGSHDMTEYQKEEEQQQEALVQVNAKLSSLEQQRNELERQVILNTPVVGATLAKAYLSDILQSRSFDTVILDEASMASIPALWCTSQLAEKSLIIVGDFLQLSPIVIAKDSITAKKWLGTDVFNLNGIQERARKGNTAPDNLAILGQQFRMEKEIAEIANRYYGEYRSLKSDDHTSFRIEERTKFYNWYNGNKQDHCVHLIDTESLGAWVTGVPQGSGHSRYNSFSAAIDVELAFKLIEKKLETHESTEDPAVLIVVPYKPQVKMVERYIESHYHARGLEDLGWVKVGTIHRFQGSEADIVIFDLVLDEPHWKANLFMPDEEMNKGLRQMFNVAVTRAKFKLFLVGNFSFCMKRAKQNALGSLLNYLVNEQRLKRIEAKSLFPNITYAPPHAYTEDDILTHELLTCKGEHFYDYLLADLQKATHRIVLFSPFITEKRLSQLLPHFYDAINQGIQIVVITKALSDHKESEKATYAKCIKALRDCGVHVIYKKNMHEKLIFIDNDILWNGSLNSLSFTGSTGEIMQRIKNKHVFDLNAKNIDLEHMLSDIEHQQEGFCPICGGKLVMSDAADGGFYWACENKDYTRNPSQPYPYDGVLRCGKCNGEFRFEMKTQPRWICQTNSKHYQNVRKNDMKLPHMLELIPKKDQKRVQEYFLNGQQTLFDAIDSAQEPNATVKPKDQKAIKNKGTSNSKHSVKQIKDAPAPSALNSIPSNARAILQLTDAGKVIKEYPSVAAAVTATGINSKSIRDAAKGVQKHAGGYCWKYKI
ncbi:MAG: AAA family ATPase [Clostridia bacterium]|nr:AAA family ATPase [Clostridia bacterium]